VIHLVTGQPGAGKTLLTLWWVRRLAEREQRTVYYSGISDLRVPGWVELEDPTTWHTLPAGSIVVIDEAQRTFRPRASGAVVPEHVARLETHRHSGIDLWLVTQHPKLIDANARRLVGLHRHVMRAFGTATVVVHEWHETKPDPDLSRDGSITTTVRYPREVFGWYKSAEVHTHRARVPLRVWLLFGSPVLLALMGYGIYAMLSSRFSEPTAVQRQALSEAGASGRAVTGQGRAVTAADYVASYQPRVPGLAYTAPAYDRTTEPRRAPRPAACIEAGQRCECWSQQATRLDVPGALCREIVRKGFFQAWDDDDDGRVRDDRVRRGRSGESHGGDGPAPALPAVRQVPAS
jgi:hypothetical protein